MAIAFDAVSNGAVTGPSGSWNHTVGSNANRILIVSLTNSNGAAYASVSAVTFNGVSMTKAVEANVQTLNYVKGSMWILHNPDSGTHAIAVTCTDSRFFMGIATSYDGAQQSSTPDATASLTGYNTTGAQNFNVTTVADNCWVICGVHEVDGSSLSATNTERYNAQYGTTKVYRGIEDNNGPKTPAGAVSVGWTLAGGSIHTWIQLAVSIAPASAGTATNSERAAKITGKSTSNSSRSAKLTGTSTTNSSRSAKVTGKSTSNSERGAKTIGSASEPNERYAQIIGQDTSSSERNAMIVGVYHAQDQRSACVTGKESTTSERSACIYGEATINSERSASINGMFDSQSERSAKIIGRDQCVSHGYFIG